MPHFAHTFGSVLEHSSPRILFVGEAVSLAHIGRPATLARWTRDAGYDVHFACGSAFASVARAEGFVPHELLTIDAGLFYARLNAGQFFYTAAELETYVRAELELFAMLRPDVIVGDFRLSLAISAQRAGIPLVALNNAHWSPDAPCRFGAPDVGLFRVLPTEVRDGLFALIRPLAFRTFAQPLNAVRRRFGMRPLNDFRQHYTAGDSCAYMDLPELYPAQAERENARSFFVGPVIWKPRHVRKLSAPELGRNRPLAYVTMGSSGHARVLPNVLRALLNADYDIALSGVNATQAQTLYRQLPDLGPRSIAAPFFDPEEILEGAAFTVCHGGSGTVYQSLAAGVPLLCLPGNPDQGLVAAAVVGRGAGLSIEPRAATVRALSAAIGTLRHHVYRVSAAEVARAIARHDTCAQWIQFLNRFAPFTVETQPELAAAHIQGERHDLA